jgi:hypothetical protein
MNALERGILNNFKQRVAARVPLDRMILFGSRARGDADPDSDMDVLVVLDSPVDWPTRKIVSECAWEASVDRGIVLVPVTVWKKEWEEGPESSSLLAIAVDRDGITV